MYEIKIYRAHFCVAYGTVATVEYGIMLVFTKMPFTWGQLWVLVLAIDVLFLVIDEFPLACANNKTKFF